MVYGVRPQKLYFAEPTQCYFSFAISLYRSYTRVLLCFWSGFKFHFISLLIKDQETETLDSLEFFSMCQLKMSQKMIEQLLLSF